jgi:hypothetical protein
MNAFQQFRDLPADPTGTFERLFRAALESLLPDLAEAVVCSGARSGEPFRIPTPDSAISN